MRTALRAFHLLADVGFVGVCIYISSTPDGWIFAPLAMWGFMDFYSTWSPE